MSDKEPREQIPHLRGNVLNKSEERFGRKQEEYGDSWVETEPDYLWRRFEEEMYEFRQAVEHKRDGEEAGEQLADALNFALMFYARVRTETEASERCR